MKKLIIIAPLMVAGCMQIRKYDGPGTQSEFMNARYQCLQEAVSISRGGGHVDVYGGSYSSATAPSCGMMATCMANKGYSQSPTGKFTPPPGTEVPCLN